MKDNFFSSPFIGIPLSEQVKNPNIIVGKHSYYSGFYHGHSFDYCARYLSQDINADKLIIGNFCSIGSGAVFMMAGNQGHQNKWISTFPFYYNKAFNSDKPNDGYEPAGDTLIGNDVWIGTEALIMPGVKIGDGAIIASRSIVTKNVKPYSIVGGNPARLIRYRFTEQEIDLLFKICWWSWEDNEIKAALPLLTSNNIKGLYDFWVNNLNSKVFK